MASPEKPPVVLHPSRDAKAILIVDGSEVSRTIVARILRAEMETATITICATGKEALEKLEQNHYCLITTALLLPDMDGLDLTRKIRDTKTHHYTPIIVVSGDAENRLLREGFEAGVTDYFDKSMGYQAFAEFVKAFTRRNSGLVGKVLFVEDSQTAAKHICKIMEKHGLQVIHTTHAEHALELLQKSTTDGDLSEFDAVITDFFLGGGMTGGDLLHAIRARLHLSQQEMPVLVLTGSDSETKQAEVFHAGANDYVAKPVIEEVLIARTRSLLLIKQQFIALREQADEMRRLATTDSLTSVYSKRYLLDNGEAYISSKRNQPVWALLMDIDHFKQINDKLGHITGDHVLAGLGEMLHRMFEGDGSMVVRFGGEEFAILMRKKTAEDATKIAENVRSSVEQLRPVNIDITVSIGLASTRDYPDADLTKLLALADKALYAAKEGGRNRICLSSSRGIEYNILGACG